MTLQEIFDKVAVHLITQNAKSENEAGDCLYRGPHGRKCAIGALIKDEFFDEEWNHQGIDCDVEEALTKSGVFPIVYDDGQWCSDAVLFKFQRLHDNSPPHEWRDALRWLAQDYGLNTKVLNDPR